MLRRLSSCLVVLALAGTAAANGRPPVTNGVFFQPGAADTLYVRSTFGLLISEDDGCSFRWVCEQNIGYGGTFDPKYAVAADGTIFATTFDGVRVSRDGGCSFETATAALPAGDPGKLPDGWFDALAIGPTGEVWVARSEAGSPNDVFRSTDNGATFSARNLASTMIAWNSVVVAAADPQRVYVAGQEFGATPVAHVRSTTDGGETWTPATLTDVEVAATPIVRVVAVAPTDPAHVYVVSVAANGGTGDKLYRSTDGGASFVEVLATTQPIVDIVIQDAATVVVATGTGGVFRSEDAGATFAPLASPPRLGCLGRRDDGALVGCAANWDPDFMAVGTSSDATQWTKIFRFIELAGPVACPVGTPQRDVCEDQMWEALKAQFGATGPTDPACAAPVDGGVDGGPPPSGGGCCDAGDRAPLGPGLLAIGLALVLGRRRRR